MSKFDKVANTKVMVRFLELAGKTGVWTTCSQAVKDYASNNFKSGDEVHIQYEDGENNMFHVTKIEKGTGEDVKKGATAQSSETKTGKPTCEDCGKELKDNKYKKCWACNKKKPASENKDRGSDVNTSIKRQAIGHMTSRSLIAMQGQVDPNNIVGLIETLYAKYKELVG